MSDNDQTVEVAWVTNTLVPGDTPVNADNVTWPQPLATGTECGDGWLQIDTYPVDAVAALTQDGLLTYGEDFDVVLEWRFEPLPACETQPPVPPTPDQPQLAETGFDPLLTIVAVAAILAGITAIRLSRKEN